VNRRVTRSPEKETYPWPVHTLAGVFYVKCRLAVIDSQKLCGLNCSRERWLLQELALSPGWSLNDRGSGAQKAPLRPPPVAPWCTGPGGRSQLPTGATTTLRVAKRYPSNEGVLRSLTPAEHSERNLTGYAIDLCFAPTFLGRFHHRHRFIYDVPSLIKLVKLFMGLSPKMADTTAKTLLLLSTAMRRSLV
jgi:hypothetical protein